jgi:hypothetical protein
MKPLITEHDGDPTPAAKMLSALSSEWEWNSLPVLMPMGAHEDHYHPLAAFAFSDMEVLPEVVEAFCDEADSPLREMGAPPVQIVCAAAVWEQFIRPGGPGDSAVSIGDDPDDLEVRLCVVYDVLTQEFSQAVHLRAEDKIGEPVWGSDDEENFNGSPLSDAGRDALRHFAETLAEIEPATDDS